MFAEKFYFFWQINAWNSSFKTNFHIRDVVNTIKLYFQSFQKVFNYLSIINECAHKKMDLLFPL